MVAYNNDVPDAPNNPSVDQPKMKINTNAVDTILAVDHISFNTTGSGHHTVVRCKDNVIDPALTVGYGEYYAKTISGDVQSFYRSSLGNIYQLTGLPSSFVANGYVTLPGGLIIQWGTNTSASGATIAFPITFPTNIFSIQTTIKQNTTNRHYVYVRSSTTANFVTTQLDSGGSAETNTFSWIAIGN